MKTPRSLCSISLALALALPLAACSRSSSRKTETTTPAAPAETAETAPAQSSTELSLKFAEVTMFAGDVAVFKLHADGSTEDAWEDKVRNTWSWRPGPTFKTDGTIVWKGKDVAKLTGEGLVGVKDDHHKVPFKLENDRVVIDNKGQPITVSIDADGKVVFTGAPNWPPKPMRIEAQGDDRASTLVIVTANFIMMAGVTPQAQIGRSMRRSG